jgi:two-component system, NarL family, nitrate/nitrite response regulator NarL
MTVRILIVDDSPLMREGVAAALKRRPRLEVVGCAEDGVQGLELAKRLEPDVILLDMNMPRLDGLGVLERIRTEMPQVRALVFTVAADEETLLNAIAAGAAGYLTKHTTVEELEDAVLTVHDGGSVISPTLAGCLLRDHGRRGAIDDSTAQPLSSRECEVLRLLAQGHTDGEVCHQLHVSPRTVRTDLACIRAKTGVRRRFGAGAQACERAAACAAP